MRFSESVRNAKQILQQAGIEDAAFEAMQLHEKQGLSREQLLLEDSELSHHQQQAIQFDLKKRCAGYPLQYLLGEWEFYSLPFQVGEGVLIPRQDTEILVDCALKLLQNCPSPTAADLCSGSGCIAISIAKHRPDCRMLAVELSEKAFSYLCKNIKLNQAENVTALRQDVLTAELEKERFDLIVSNPPYLTEEEMRHLQREVTFEPALALDGGKDGLFFYRKLIQNCYPALKSGGFLAFECGWQQAEALCTLFLQQGYRSPTVLRDYAGNDRVVYAQKMT